jgi:hypothetical protein
MDSSIDAEEQRKAPLMHAAEDSRASIEPIREWTSWKVEPTYTGVIALIGSLMIAAIIILAALSQRNTGFVTILGQHQTSKGTIFDKYVSSTGLLWTSLPSLIVTFYNLAWGCIATAAIDRQPFIDLLRKEGTIPSRSIALDYRTKIPGWNCIVALRNRHFLVGGLMSVALPMSVMAAAAAHLFVLRSVVSADNTSLALTTAFNASNLTASTDLRRSLDLVQATRIYGASPPPWTDGEYAFPSISLPISSTTFNLTAKVDAQAAYLICRTLDSTEYTTRLENTSDPSIQRLLVAGSDRGCGISTHVDVQSKTTTYLRTFSQLDCASDETSRRFGLVSGTYLASSPTLLQDFSVISCIPQYWTIPGRLGLSKVTSKKAPVIDSFTRDVAGATQFGLNNLAMGALFESGLDVGIAIDITNEISTTEFGRVVLQRAQDLGARSLDSEVLQDAMSEVFTSTFAMLSSTTLFNVLANEARPVVAIERSTTVQRLFVYLPVASLLCAVLGLSVLCTISTSVYSRKHSSILREEPSGLLSYADILLGSSGIDYLLKKVRAHPEYDGRTMQLAQKCFELESIHCSTTSEGKARRINCSEAKLVQNAAN